jgi:hypothetical protein
MGQSRSARYCTSEWSNSVKGMNCFSTYQRLIVIPSSDTETLTDEIIARRNT